MTDYLHNHVMEIRSRNAKVSSLIRYFHERAVILFLELGYN